MHHPPISFLWRSKALFLVLCALTFAAGLLNAQNRENRTNRRSSIDIGNILATQMLAHGDRNGDESLDTEEFRAVARSWFGMLSDGKISINQDQMTQRFPSIASSDQAVAAPSRLRQPLVFLGARGLFTATDSDKNGSVTEAEFRSTFTAWFNAWDEGEKGRLNQSVIAAGLNAAMPRPRRGRFGPRTPELDDAVGFKTIFDGKTLTGWDGDPRFWRAENGEIIGESSEANPVEQNTFLIWQDGTTRDFEFKLEFKISEYQRTCHERSRR